MAIPNTGAGGSASRERFIFPTVRIPPTYAGYVGVFPGIPEPDTNNKAKDVRLGLSGQYRTVPAGQWQNPYIKVAVEDLGTDGAPRFSVQRAGRVGLSPAITDDMTAITGTTTANAATTITISGGLALTELAAGNYVYLSSNLLVSGKVLTVPSNTQITVDTALGDGSSQTLYVNSSAKLTRSWGLKETVSLIPPTGNVTFPALTWSLAGKSPPSLLELPDATWRLIYMVTATDGSHTRRWCVVKKYDPNTGATWTDYCDFDLVSILGGEGVLQGSDGSAIASIAAAYRPNDAIYIAVAGGFYTDTVSGYSPGLATLSLQDTTPRLISIVYANDGASCNGGVALAFGVDGGGVAALDAALYGGAFRRVHIMSSPDLRTWTELSGQAAFAAVHQQSRVGTAARGNVTKFSFADTNTGYAVTDAGEILMTTNAGISWQLCDTPTNRLHGGAAVVLYGISVAGTTIYAVGRCAAPTSQPIGLIYKSTDSGATWKLVLLGLPSSLWTQWFDRGDIAQASSEATVPPLRAVHFVSTSKGWAVGDASTILYTADGGTNWTIVSQLRGLPPSPRGPKGTSLYAVIADTANNLLVAGTQQDALNVGVGKRTCRFAFVANATTVLDPDSSSFVYLAPVTTGTQIDDAPFVAMSRPSTAALFTDASTVIFGVTAAGGVWRWNGTGSAYTLSLVSQLPLATGNPYVDVCSPAGSAATVYVLRGATVPTRRMQTGPTQSPILWASSDGTASAVTFLAETVSGTSSLATGALFFSAAGVGVVAVGNALRAYTSTQDNRCLPAIMGLPDGNYLLAINNQYQGTVEIYRGSPEALSLVSRPMRWTTVAGGTTTATSSDFSGGSQTITIAGALTTYLRAGMQIALSSAPTTWATILNITNTTQFVVNAALGDGSSQTMLIYGTLSQPAVSQYIPRLSFTRTVEGDYVLTAGPYSFVSEDEGRTWLAGSSGFHLPVSDFTPDAGSTTGYHSTLVYLTRSMAALGNGRLVSAVSSSSPANIGIFWSRDWSTATADASLPHAAGEVMKGYDPCPRLPRPQWLGIDGVCGQLHGDPAVGDSWLIPPDYEFGVTNLTVVDTPSVQWRSDDVSGEAVLLWDRQSAAATAIYGAGQFWDVTSFALFRTNFRECKFAISDRANDANFTEYDLIASVAAAGTAVRLGSGASNVYYDSAATWIPGQFNSGPLRGQGERTYYVYFATPGTVYRIISNTTNCLVINGNPTLASGTGAYTIFADRLCWMGDIGTGDAQFTGQGTPPNDSKTLGLRDSNYRFGRYVRVTIPVQACADAFFQIGAFVIGIEPPPDTAGRSFGFGFTHSQIINTQQQKSLANVATVEHFGRTGNVWAFSYQAETRDALIRKLGPLSYQGRMPFAWKFINDTNNESLEYVRLVDAVKITNVGMDLYRADWQVEEVV